MDVHESRKRQSPFLKLKLFPLKKGKKKVFKFICCNVLADTSYYKHLTLKTNKSSYLMFIVFLSNPLHLDIYACLHQLLVSASSSGSKRMFRFIIHASVPSKNAAARSKVIKPNLGGKTTTVKHRTSLRKTVFALT